MISESFADSLAHWSIHDVDIEVRTGEVLSEVRVLPGQRVNSGDVLAIVNTNYRNKKGSNEGVDINKETTEFTSIEKIVPHDISDGYVIAVEHQANRKREKKGKGDHFSGIIFDCAEKTEEVIKEWESRVKNADLSSLKDVPSRYLNQSISKHDFGKKTGAETMERRIVRDVIKVKIAVRRPVVIGDKVCNRYGLATNYVAWLPYAAMRIE